MLSDWWRAAFPDARTRVRRRALREAVERFVAETDPRVRAVRRYRRRLLEPVESALDYAESVAARIPGPVAFDASHWMDDALVHAFFSSVDALRTTFSRSRELRRFFAAHPDAAEVYCVLAATLETRTTFVVREIGGGPPREVAARSVGFSDCMVLLPCEREAPLRRHLTQLVFNGLARAAVMLQERAAEDEKTLVDERAQLRLRAQIARREGRCLDALLAGSGDGAHDASLPDVLAEVEQRVAAARRASSAPDAGLERLLAVLERPQAHTYLRDVSFRLDRMNLDLPEGADGVPVRLVQATGPRGTRVAVVARFARADLLPEAAVYLDAEKALG
ncbi:MAG: hypothetical protein MUE39_05245 [Gammaproteobacteria bacterium]|jgi:hypothetical protein|nr:hypothetical protein [Gammaproteobacteria bacterium]